MDEQGLGQNEFNTKEEYKVILKIIKFRTICSFKHFMPTAEASFMKKGYMLGWIFKLLKCRLDQFTN